MSAAVRGVVWKGRSGSAQRGPGDAARALALRATGGARWRAGRRRMAIALALLVGAWAAANAAAQEPGPGGEPTVPGMPEPREDGPGRPGDEQGAEPGFPGLAPDTSDIGLPGLRPDTSGVGLPGLGPDTSAAGLPGAPGDSLVGGAAPAGGEPAGGGTPADGEPVSGAAPARGGLVGGGVVPDTSGVVPLEDLERRGSREEPPLPVPEKPPVHQFRLGAEVSAFAWDEDAGADDNLFAGLDVERDLAPFLAARAGLVYGTTQLEPNAAGRTGGGDVRLYLPEVSLLAQHELPAFGDGGATPYALLGFGSLITDPDGEGSTRSQNAFSYGAGLRLRFGERVGVRGEVKRYLIKLEDPFDPVGQDSESVNNLRIAGSLIYAL